MALSTTIVDRAVILLRNLNLRLLLHLNLNIGDSGRNLAVDHQVRGWGRALPNLVLADNLDPSLGLLFRRPGPDSPHERWRLLRVSLVQHLLLL